MESSEVILEVLKGVMSTATSEVIKFLRQRKKLSDRERRIVLEIKDELHQLMQTEEKSKYSEKSAEILVKIQELGETGRLFMDKLFINVLTKVLPFYSKKIIETEVFARCNAILTGEILAQLPDRKLAEKIGKEAKKKIMEEKEKLREEWTAKR